jgi:hypothetical protein
MTDLDRWLAELRTAEAPPSAIDAAARIARQIQNEPGPQWFAARRARRHMIGYVCSAGLLGFCLAVLIDVTQPGLPLWVSAAPADSLAALLAGAP